MMEFLVHMDLNFPSDMSSDDMQAHYAMEAQRASEMTQSGIFKRVWRIPGRRSHISLWECHDATELHDALQTWPMFMYMDIEVTPLAVNINDPGGIATELPFIDFTYDVLKTMAVENHAVDDEHGYPLGYGLSIHYHPTTDRGAQVHVMHDDAKIAEIGPNDDSGETIAPGYIDVLYKWEGKAVLATQWQNRILRDNGLLSTHYADVRTTAHSRKLIRGQ